MTERHGTRPDMTGGLEAVRGLLSKVKDAAGKRNDMVSLVSSECLQSLADAERELQVLREFVADIERAEDAFKRRVPEGRVFRDDPFELAAASVLSALYRLRMKQKGYLVPTSDEEAKQGPRDDPGGTLDDEVMPSAEAGAGAEERCRPEPTRIVTATQVVLQCPGAADELCESCAGRAGCRMYAEWRAARAMSAVERKSDPLTDLTRRFETLVDGFSDAWRKLETLDIRTRKQGYALADLQRDVADISGRAEALENNVCQAPPRHPRCTTCAHGPGSLVCATCSEGLESRWRPKDK